MDLETRSSSMKGLGFRKHGGLDQIGWVEVPKPEPPLGAVRVEVKTSAFNHLDLFVLEGWPGLSVDLPHVVGSDAAGRVDQLGQGADGLPRGSEVLVNPGMWDGTCDYCRAGNEVLCRDYRILGEHTQGSATRFVVVPRRNVHAKPGRLSWAEAAAAPLVFQTAWRALKTVGELRPGESVAVVGAGGGVATAAIQVAKRLGARVAAVSRSPVKAERATRLGADEGLVMSEERPLDRLLWEWSGKRGVDLIFDSVGAPTLSRSLRAVSRGGRVVVIGGTAGPKAEVDVRLLFGRHASIRGTTMAGPNEFESMLAELASGHLRPVVDSEWEWGRGVEAFRRLTEPDLFGKVVLNVSR